MLDTMTLTKAVSAICGALLVFLIGNWVASSIYHVGGGHGDHEQAYSIDTGGDDHGGGEEAVAEIDFGAVYEVADAAAGERLWRPCGACHKLEDGANGVGPHLYGVVGRDKGSVAGYAYSEAMATVEGDWTPENLQAFLENPKSYVAGTKMNFNGMKDVEDRANLIAYLASIGS